MSSPQQQHTPVVSLFPFLAVLLCTMGALIVVLVAIAHQAQGYARRRAQVMRQQTQAQLQEQIRQLDQQLQHLQQQLQHQRQQVAWAQSSLERLRRARDQLAQQIQQLQKQLQTQDDSQSQKHLEELKRRLVWYQHKLLELRQKLESEPAQQEPVSYAIVPFQGRHGTRRRPIYIECRKDSVLIQPGGIELKARDFVSAGPENPLLAALRATVRYWRRQGLAAQETPYPLVLVRPEGIAAFYAVRRALQRWKGPFGYELIEQDWQLEFGAADPELVQQQRLAVQNARRVLVQLAQTEQGGGAGPSGQLYRADPLGGLAAVDGSPFADSGEGLPGESGSARGFGQQPFRPSRASVPKHSPGGVSPRLGSATPAGQGASGLDPGSLLASGPTLPGSNSGRGTSLPTAPASSGKTSHWETGSGTRSAPAAQAAGNLAKLPSSDLGTTPGNPSASGTKFPASSFTGLGQGPGGNSSAAGQGPAGGLPGKAVAGEVGRGETAVGGLGSGASAPGGIPGLGSSRTLAASGSGSGPVAASDAPAGFGAFLGSPSPPASQAQHHDSHDHLATLTGPQTPGDIPLHRPIRLNLYPDRVVLVHSGTLRTTAVSLNQPLGRWSAELVDALVREIQSWGKAGRGMYWKPELRVFVAPGAQDRWEQLTQVVQPLGLKLRLLNLSSSGKEPMR